MLSAGVATPCWGQVLGSKGSSLNVKPGTVRVVLREDWQASLAMSLTLIRDLHFVLPDPKHQVW